MDYRLIEGAVEDWVMQCESKKNQFSLWEVDPDKFADNRLALAIRKALADLIIKNVSMIGLFTVDMQTRPDALQAAELEDLCRVPFNSEVRQRCEIIRENAIASLKMMKLFW